VIKCKENRHHLLAVLPERLTPVRMCFLADKADVDIPAIARM
jgi:hypothetical protein